MTDYGPSMAWTLSSFIWDSGNYTSPSTFKITGLLLSHNACSRCREKTLKPVFFLKFKNLCKWIWVNSLAHGMKFRSILSMLPLQKVKNSVRGNKLFRIPEQGRCFTGHHWKRFSSLPWLWFWSSSRFCSTCFPEEGYDPECGALLEMGSCKHSQRSVIGNSQGQELHTEPVQVCAGAHKLRFTWSVQLAWKSAETGKNLLPYLFSFQGYHCKSLLEVHL